MYKRWHRMRFCVACALGPHAWRTPAGGIIIAALSRSQHHLPAPQPIPPAAWFGIKFLGVATPTHTASCPHLPSGVAAETAGLQSLPSYLVLEVNVCPAPLQ